MRHGISGKRLDVALLDAMRSVETIDLDFRFDIHMSLVRQVRLHRLHTTPGERKGVDSSTVVAAVFLRRHEAPPVNKTQSFLHHAGEGVTLSNLSLIHI